MAPVKVVIAPKRSVAFFALLAIVMVFVSYLLILAIAAACVYFPYLAISGTESFQLQLGLLFLGGIATAGALLWSLVPRRDKFIAPGLLLDRLEQPALFAELDEIAATLNEPLPDEVYLIGDMNAFVADRGGMMGFGSHRILAIGLPLLPMLTVSEFRAILAHEFAHYYSGDTRMGPWVYKTQSAMIRSFRGIGAIGNVRIGVIQVLILLVNFVLKWYFLFFLRVINLVSRHKEYRADELACLVAGAEPMVSGLRKIHGGSMAWGPYWSGEVAPILSKNCLPPIGDGFTQFLGVPHIAEEVSRGIEEEIAEGNTNPYDTHPPLRDRIAAIRKMAAKVERLDDVQALSLVRDPASMELRFLEAVNPKLPKDSLQRVGWNEMALKVTIPEWRAAVQEYAPLLDGISTDSLPEVMLDLSKIGSRIRDPKGMLLTPEERQVRAKRLLSMAVGLLLLEAGWQVECGPGVFRFQRNGQDLDVLGAIESIARGSLPAGPWQSMCKQWGIAGTKLANSSADGRGSDATRS